jgi:hypothetical protein
LSRWNAGEKGEEDGWVGLDWRHDSSRLVCGVCAAGKAFPLLVLSPSSVLTSPFQKSMCLGRFPSPSVNPCCRHVHPRHRRALIGCCGKPLGSFPTLFDDPVLPVNAQPHMFPLLDHHPPKCMSTCKIFTRDHPVKSVHESAFSSTASLVPA